MCEGREALRSFEIGLSPPVGWVKTNFSVVVPGSQVNDCVGWTVTSGSYLYLGGLYCPPGPLCGVESAFVSNDYCTNSHEILCCD